MKLEPMTFIDLVYDYLTHLDGVTVEDTDADPDSREAIYQIRHDALGLATELRVPEQPSFSEAQEWCLGFLGKPLHLVMAVWYETERKCVGEEG